MINVNVNYDNLNEEHEMNVKHNSCVKMHYGI
jgi:hypothetical protein